MNALQLNVGVRRLQLPPGGKAHLSTLRRPSLKGVYAFLFVVTGLAIQYLPGAVPGWLVQVFFLEMVLVAGGFLFELRRDRREAEAAREAELRRREANPLPYSHQPGQTPTE